MELEHGGDVLKLQVGCLVPALLDHAGQLLCHGVTQVPQCLYLLLDITHFTEMVS